MRFNIQVCELLKELTEGDIKGHIEKEVLSEFYNTINNLKST